MPLTLGVLGLYWVGMSAQASPVDFVATWNPPAGAPMRLQKAKENYLCAQHALSKNRFNAAASRYYYALHLASMELFDAKGMVAPPVPRVDRNTNQAVMKSVWTHSNVAQQIILATGDISHANFWRQCLTERERADYHPTVGVDGTFYRREIVPRVKKALEDIFRLVLATKAN